ncbi:MAG: cupin domain-containing protein [Actinomycetales bacterium]|jgi:hypothetical protein|nr:cupin domain-containing protein [Leifsonia sp.]
MTTSLSFDGIEWPAATAVPADRVSAGSPATSTFVLHSENGTEAGLWRVTPGEFSTIHRGYTEIIVIHDGDGELVDDDGSALPLRPGAIIMLEDGWSGCWVIRRTVTKSYTIVSRS